MSQEEDMTVPSVTRHDTVKVALYVFFGLLIAFGLVAGTIWLFTAG
jgi:hypothetical protein